MWKVNTKRENRNNNIPPIMTCKDNRMMDSEEIAVAFTTYIFSVYNEAQKNDQETDTGNDSKDRWRSKKNESELVSLRGFSTGNISHLKLKCRMRWRTGYFLTFTRPAESCSRLLSPTYLI